MICAYHLFLLSFNRYRRKRSKVDASIFDSALSHTRRSARRKKREKILASTFGRFRLWTSFKSSAVSVNLYNISYKILLIYNITYISSHTIHANTSPKNVWSNFGRRKFVAVVKLGPVDVRWFPKLSTQILMKIQMLQIWTTKKRLSQLQLSFHR